MNLDVSPDPRLNTNPDPEPDPNTGNSTDGRPRQHPCSGIAHLDATARLQILPEESALENGGLGELSPPGPVAPPGPRGMSTDPPIPHSGICPRDTGLAELWARRRRLCIHGWVLAHQQLRALLLKRFLLARCSRCGLFAQVRGARHEGGRVGDPECLFSTL